MARLLAAATLAATAGAFVTTAPVTTPVSVRAENSEAFPFLARPEKLDGSMIGDVGFDPLRLAEVQVDLTYARGAEVKHGRIAMLACVGFVIQEYAHIPGADYQNSHPLTAPRSVPWAANLQLLQQRVLPRCCLAHHRRRVQLPSPLRIARRLSLATVRTTQVCTRLRRRGMYCHATIAP